MSNDATLSPFQRSQAAYRAEAAAVIDRPYPRQALAAKDFKDRSWEYVLAFADELATRGDHITSAHWRTAIDALRTGLPVIIDRRDDFGGVTRNIYIINNISEPTPASAGYLRVRSWGFSFDMNVRDIVDLKAPTIESVD